MNVESCVIGINKHIMLDDVLSVSQWRRVTIEPASLSLIQNRRNDIVNFVENSDNPAYGFNRGFGHNVDLPVPSDLLQTLQRNLIRSHASGVGEPTPHEVVRAAMFLRASSLIRGHSGVRPEIIQLLVEMLNHKITPQVPLYGSVGASGDLAPLSHIALVMMGEGKAYVNGRAEAINSADALKAMDLEPIVLEMKEGLALNNGIQVTTAFGVLSYFKVKNLLNTATIATAISTQVLLGADTPFLPELHQLRPHPGAVIVANWINNLMKDSPIREAHRRYSIDGEVQDPYSLRCAAQILGTCYDLIEEARKPLEIEINSVTDNPVILPDPKMDDKFVNIVSGGHFHGMPIAVKLYGLLQSMGIMASLSNTRCARFVDQTRTRGLDSDLKWPGPEVSDGERATLSGMMVPEYASAALTNIIWGACMPSHLFSISTDAGQEDHVSMSSGLAVRLWQTIPRLAELLAIELAFGAQAAAIRKNMDYLPSKKGLSPQEHTGEIEKKRQEFENAIKKTIKNELFDVCCEAHLKYNWKEEQRMLSPVTEKILASIYEFFPPLIGDRVMSDELQNLANFILSGNLVSPANEILSVEDGIG